VIEGLTLSKVLSLGVADSVNPCTLGVLSVMLVAMLTYNPKKRKNVLFAGLAFTTSVYFLYLFYGIFMVKFFQIAQMLAVMSSWLYKILGAGAIILGIWNIKDFILKTGSCAVVPKISERLQKITSPKGAFVLGALVTVFLLPCTIGPLIILTGILSFLQIIKTLPYLLFYNLIFVSPMLGITVLVYAGLSTIEDINVWQVKNMKYLSLIAGSIMIVLGIAMVMGFI